MRASRHIPALVLGLLCLIPLLAASVAWFDDGELAAAAATLGVPHPTGFPLFVMGNHGGLMLPFGSLAFRIHLAGALVAVCAVAICWSAIGPRSRLGWPWTLGAIVMGLSSPSLAMHVRATEVYPWVWLHASCVLWVTVRAQGVKRLVGLWALGGIGVAIHSESAALSLVFALAALWTVKVPWRIRLRAVMSGCVLAVFVAAGIVALPLMASRDPMLSWGDVTDLRALWDHVSARSIRRAFSGRIGVASSQSFEMLTQQVLGDLGGLVWAVVPALGWLTVKRRVVPCLGLLAFDVGYALWVNPMGLRDAQVGLVTTLILTNLVWLSVVVAIKFTLRTLTSQSRHRAMALAIVLCALVWTRGHRLVERAPQGELEAAADLADHLFDGVPPGALMLASSDQRASSCIWLQAAVGSRPDTRCLPIVFTRSATILRQLARVGVGDGFGRAAADVRAAKSPKERAAVMAHWLRPALQKRAVLWQQGQGFEDAQVADHLIAGYPWDRLQMSPSMDAGADVKKGLRQADIACARALQSDRCEPGTAVSANVASWAAIWGAWLLRRGQRDGAKTPLEAAVHWGPQSASALNNLAVLRMQDDQPQQALSLCRRALRAQPDYVRAHRTASRAAVRSGDQGALTYHASAWLRYERRPSRWLDSLASDASNPQISRQIEDLRSSR